ncbi:TPA: hypothetical protein ACH3X1_001016 [Trebouxia sp. C0004]
MNPHNTGTYSMTPMLFLGHPNPKTYSLIWSFFVEDLKKLWRDGFRVWDPHRKQHFTVKGGLWCTTHDIPASKDIACQTTQGAVSVWDEHLVVCRADITPSELLFIYVHSKTKCHWSNLALCLGCHLFGQEPPKVSTRNAKLEFLSSSEQRLLKLHALTRLSSEEQSHMLRWAILHFAHNDAAATTTCDVHGRR